jgi:hypothetical protein
MFVFCVLYSKDKRQSQANEDKAAQTKYRERTKKIPPGAWMVSVVIVECCQVEVSATG